MKIVKICFACLALLFTNSIFAAANAKQSAFEGFYIGVAGGVSDTDFPFNIDTAGGGGLRIQSYLSGKSSTLSGMAQIYAGFRHQINDFFPGIQIAMNYHHYNDQPSLTKHQDGASILNITTPQINSNGLGGSIIGQLGYLVSPSTIIYGGIGWTLAYFDLNTTYSANDAPPPQTANPPMVNYKRQYRNGLIVNLGFETWIMRHWTFSTNYLYSNYGTITTAGSVRSTVNSSSLYSGTANMRLRVQSFLLGLSYYFKGNDDLPVLVPNSNFDKWLLSLGIGITNPRFHLQNSSLYVGSSVGAGNRLILSNINDIGEIEPMITLALERGGVLLRRFYLAGDIFASFGTKMGQSDVSRGFSLNTSFFIKQTQEVRLRGFEYGADLVSGLLLEPNTLLYVKTGLALNRATYTANSEIVSGPNTDLQTNKAVTGLRLGAGVRVMLKKNFAISLEYINTYYGHMDLSLNRLPRSATADLVSNSSEISLLTQNVVLSTSYTF